MNQSVASILTKDVAVPTLNDMGDPIKTPGRRVNGYSEQEYLESFFGKDMARRVTTEAIQNPLLREEKDLKEKFPLSKFSQLAEHQEREKKLKEFGIEFDYKQYPKLLPKDP